MILTCEQMFDKIQVRNFTCVFERLTKGGANMEEYKKHIIRMIENINDERFLRQIYTIIVRHTRKAGN